MTVALVALAALVAQQAGEARATVPPACWRASVLASSCRGVTRKQARRCAHAFAENSTQKQESNSMPWPGARRERQQWGDSPDLILSHSCLHDTGRASDMIYCLDRWIYHCGNV